MRLMPSIGTFVLCNSAEHGEPCLELLGRDHNAPVLVEMLAHMRKFQGGKEDDYVRLLMIAKNMRSYRADLEEKNLRSMAAEIRTAARRPASVTTLPIPLRLRLRRLFRRRKATRREIEPRGA